MDLYFEILREKVHILCQAKETSTVMELKLIIQGILKVTPAQQTLKKPANEGKTEWTDLNDNKATLLELGYTQKNARADEPAVLALVLPDDNGAVHITSVSSPPPLPEAMRHTREAEFES